MMKKRIFAFALIFLLLFGMIPCSTRVYAYSPDTPQSPVLILNVYGDTDTVIYDGKRHSVSGYSISVVYDEIGAYEDGLVSFSGYASASGVEVGEYSMGLSSSQFSFLGVGLDVTINIASDGKLTINEDPEAEYMRPLDEVIELIDSIGKVTYTKSVKERIDAARNAYDALEEDLKDRLTSEVYKILTDAEAKYAEFDRQAKEAAELEKKAKADKAAAEEAVGKINAIGTVEYTDASHKLISTARESYDALTPDQKALIDSGTYRVLTDAETVYSELDKKAKADRAAAEAVISNINAIGTVEYTDASHKLISTARESYDALTSEQKAHVVPDMYKVLTDAENKYAELEKKAREAEEKDKADKAAAEAVIVQIDAIGTSPGGTSFSKEVSLVRESYDALTEDQKKLVPSDKYKILTDAEADKAVVDGILKKMDEIDDPGFPEPWTLTIEVIRAQEGLTVGQKRFYTDLMLKMWLRYVGLYSFLSPINEIGNVEYTEECKARIDYARSIYDKIFEYRLDNYIAFESEPPSIFVEYKKVLLDAEAEYARLAELAGKPALEETTSSETTSKTNEVQMISEGSSLVWKNEKKNKDLNNKKNEGITFKGPEISLRSPECSASIKIHGEAPYEKYKITTVDGEEVSEEFLIITPGSTIVEILPEYLETLSNGTHTVTIIWDDGTVESSLNVDIFIEDNPEEPLTETGYTADRATNAGTVIVVIAGAILLAGAGLLTFFKRKH